MTDVRLLVVEDDQDMREMLGEALEEEGFAVQAAASGIEALALAQECPFDLLITDVRMGGMDGLEMLAGLKALQPAIRSIIITGYASQDAPLRAIQLEASDYLYKPFSLAELLAAVERVVQAEGERQKTDRLLETLALGFKHMQAPDVTSARAFSSFYVAVRSRNLSLAGAVLAWDLLEQGRCQQALELVSTDLRQQPAGFPAREPGQVSRARFADFYKRVQQGEIPSHQLAAAAYLRVLDGPPAPDLRALCLSIWGEPDPD